MRSLVTILTAVLLLSAPYVARLQAAAAHVNQCYGFTFGATTVSCQITGATSGNTYAAFVVHFSGSTLNSISDGSDSFTLRHANTSGATAKAGMGYLLNDASSGSITFTATFSASDAGWIVVHEISGVDTFDVSAMLAATVGTGTDELTSGSVTAAGAGYVFGGTTQDGFDSPVINAGTSFTERTEPFDITAGSTESRVIGAGGSVAATFTQNTPSEPYITGVMVFREPTGGGGPSNCNMLLLRVGC